MTDIVNVSIGKQVVSKGKKLVSVYNDDYKKMLDRNVNMKTASNSKHFLCFGLVELSSTVTRSRQSPTDDNNKGAEETDKCALEINTAHKGEKLLLAKENVQNKILESTPVWLHPSYGLGSRVYGTHSITVSKTKSK